MDIKDLKRLIKDIPGYTEVFFYSAEDKCLCSATTNQVSVIDTKLASNLECKDNPIKRRIKEQELMPVKVVVIGG